MLRSASDERAGRFHPIDLRIERLVADLAGRGSVLVAYSGGVDSAVVAALAYRAVGERALAVTAAAETLAGAELDHARRLAAEIGIRHEMVTYSELDDPEFVANPSHRCYVCQGMRMDRMLAGGRGSAATPWSATAPTPPIPAPTGPGCGPSSERAIYSPLLAHGVDKETTRAIALALGLSVWDRPANACLSSRIPHGQLVTLGKLRRIEAAEEVLTEAGFRVVRVRHEVRRRAPRPVSRSVPDEVGRLAGLWDELEPRLRALGFQRVAYDPQGYRRGGADLPASPAPSSLPAREHPASRRASRSGRCRRRLPDRGPRASWPSFPTPTSASPSSTFTASCATASPKRSTPRASGPTISRPSWTGCCRPTAASC